MSRSRINAVIGALLPSERFMLSVTAVALLVDFLLIVLRGTSVDWLSYGALVLLIGCLLGAGMAYRLSGRSVEIAAALIGAGGFLLFSMALSLFNYMLLPLNGPTMDASLASVDALMGYHWPDVMAWAADHPGWSLAMKYAYMSTIPQFALLIVLLGLTGRADDLHQLLVSVTITATFTICFWGIFPSIGSTSLYDLPDELWQQVSPVVDLAYANDLKAVIAFGPETISPKEVRGLVAFPSYHAVLAFTAVYISRRILWLFPFFLAVNLLILPSIFIHGGHHFVDLPAGFAVFLLGMAASRYAVSPAPGATKKSQLVIN